ncbi:uncharacterized protein LOC62_02G002213 [Vanrija pseudolonga]|uniref:Uncharacterized protein n=1 Tax=Vanrija pseudolonga TaxID=143232 RepID=A0AAF1BJR3_9TREE|nr:hypothetical protein LOC62_02G002213 [Vanrija pseudolonga]
MPDNKASASPPPNPNPPWGSAPTLANLELEPRLRLRDGSHSSASTRSSMRPASRSRGGSRQRRGSTRSEGLDSVVSSESTDMPAATNTTAAAANADPRSTRRLPRLNSRPRRPTPERQDNDSSSEDEPLALSRSRSPVKRSATARHTEVIGSSSSSSSPDSGAARRFTAAEKGKGRAAPPSPTPIEVESDSDDSPLLADESIQFIKQQAPSPLPVEDEVESVIGEDEAITAYTRGGRGRGRGRGGRGGGRGGHQVQPTEWDTDSLREAVTTQADSMLRNQIQANGTREERGEARIEHPLKGLWQVQGSWVIEGECPVCRERIPGGLGPIGSGIGGVILLEAMVRHAGDLV